MGWEQDPAVGPETRGLLPAIPGIPGDVCGSVAEDHHPEARRDEVCGDADLHNRWRYSPCRFSDDVYLKGDSLAIPKCLATRADLSLVVSCACSDQISLPRITDSLKLIAKAIHGDLPGRAVHDNAT